MNTMFSNNETKTIPNTLEECYQGDAVSNNLWLWGDRLEKLGKILFYILIAIGFLVSVFAAGTTGYGVFYLDEFQFDVFLSSAITYGIYAFIEYCAYHVLALLICALASIVQNNRIAANVALYKAATDEKTE